MQVILSTFMQRNKIAGMEKERVQSVPRVSIDNANRNYRPSDLFVEKGDFLRLKNLTLGYTVPKSALSKLENVTGPGLCNRSERYLLSQSIQD